MFATELKWVIGYDDRRILIDSERVKNVFYDKNVIY